MVGGGAKGHGRKGKKERKKDHAFTLVQGSSTLISSKHDVMKVDGKLKKEGERR